MAFWSRIGTGKSGRVTKWYYTWASCIDAKLTDDSFGRLFHTTSHKVRIWFTQSCLSIAVDTAGIKDGVHSLRWSISYIIFERSPCCTLDIRLHESIHLLCRTEEVVFMQPLKKLFNLPNSKARNLSQLNTANATAQCLALVVLTVEVNEYSDWLNWRRIVSFIRLLCQVPNSTRFQASAGSKRELRSSGLIRRV